MAETFVLITGAWHGGWAWRLVGHSRGGYPFSREPLRGAALD